MTLSKINYRNNMKVLKNWEKYGKIIILILQGGA